MPRSKKNDLAKVMACLDTICPKCGHRITPDRIVRVDFEDQKCPACGEVFDPKNHWHYSGEELFRRSFGGAKEQALTIKGLRKDRRAT
jgi:predicted RNA-binding Zn-ribbon protein involved in translation (DUF1610 family)